MSVKTIEVRDSQALDSSITGFLNQGYTVASRSDTRASLQKIKQPLSAAMIILGLIIPFIGWAFLIGYLVVHASEPASKVIEITVRAA